MSGILGGLLALAVSTLPADPVAPLRAEAQAIREHEAADLRKAADSAQKADPARARAILALLDPPPAADGSIRFLPLPAVVAASDPKAAIAEVAKIRESAGEALFQLAARAARGGRYALASECLRGVVARQPDHAEARRLLGYVPHRGGWASPFAVEMLKRDKVDHPTYGWIPVDWVEHLEKGELPGRVVNGRPERWLPADKADALRNEIRKGWEISTEHFQIRTSAPLSEAIAFGRRLEHFHDLFTSLMADVIGVNGALAQRYRGEAANKEPIHETWYFATKREYVNYLKQYHGKGVDLELGRYDPATRPGAKGRSYFYRDQDQAISINATLYHEASHQLLFESGLPPSEYESNRGQYWVFEGLGTYFETVNVDEDGTLEVSGFVGPRLALMFDKATDGDARSREIREQKIVPLDRFVGLTKTRFDGAGGGDVYFHYAQSMALAVFLMNGEGRKYQADFLDYVADAYAGRFGQGGTGRPLADRLGVSSYKELQDQFLEFLKSHAGDP